MTIGGCLVGRGAHTYVQKHDETRISRYEWHRSDAIKQERIDTRAEHTASKEFLEEEEGVLYGPDTVD
ncbi:hypothetical protein TNCV_3189691 [Trichonephila clavipes]|nr:hypothetical protein TNCV_3189691 [Trichonephila clavipes]